jgi:hypothetical protein
MNFEQRKRRIEEIAATNYQFNDDAAREYLAAIEGSKLDEQKKLFAIVISQHGARAKIRLQRALKNTVPGERWRNIAERLDDMVGSWVRAANRSNSSIEDTANTLWDHLTLREAGEDRIVALDLLLQKVAPYAHVPPDLTIVEPIDMYREAHDVIVREIALLKRVQRLEGVTIHEVAAACEKLLAQFENKIQRTALLLSLINSVFDAVKGNVGINLILAPHSRNTGQEDD